MRKVTIELSPALHKRLRMQALQEDTTVKALLVSLIEQHLKGSRR